MSNLYVFNSYMSINTNIWPRNFTAHGLSCHVMLVEHNPSKRSGGGFGYVAIPKTHNLYGRNFMDIEEYFHIHGGISFSGHQIDFNLPYNEDVWYFGWMACYFKDNHMMKKNESNGIPIDMKYLVDQTTLLASQLSNLTLSAI